MTDKKKSKPLPQMHCLMTIQWSEETGHQVGVVPGTTRVTMTVDQTLRTLTFDGLIDPVPGTTRQDLMVTILKAAKERAGLPQDATVAVLHWSAHKNKLS
ncbi:hypothetical protein [Streptomyces sp. NPDC051079]|uniref:hypothetical protein n=1 Tax=Streptomyces sp. NPDC051079 TaxID=3155043 RepID=UPI00344C3EBE